MESVERAALTCGIHTFPPEERKEVFRGSGISVGHYSCAAEARVDEEDCNVFLDLYDRKQAVFLHFWRSGRVFGEAVR
jgi:hypothetical protein